MKITATGGGDAPEDVVGGIDQAVSFEWPKSSGTRVLFHLGDAPPHGRPKYHSYDDEYPDGHSRDKPLEILFSEMLNKIIKYFFGRINDYCDTMIQVFEKYYVNSERCMKLCEVVCVKFCKLVSSCVQSCKFVVKCFCCF